MKFINEFISEIKWLVKLIQNIRCNYLMSLVLVNLHLSLVFKNIGAA